MQLKDKLAILADAAKYDASCASSGAGKRHSLGKGGIGSTEGMGICHSYTPDGRCVSLLKILLTNFCIYDCAYCVNSVSSNVPRARFATAEVVRLTLEFYKRNYIEGLFLSSGIIRNGDYTMEQLVEVARSLREDHRFAGYIHLKTIPEASPELLAAAGRYADRLSINVELPTEAGLKQLAPQKDAPGIRAAMGELHTRILAARPSKQEAQRQVPTWNYEAVHARGIMTVRDDEKFVRSVVGGLTRLHEAAEPKPWRMSDTEPDYLADMLRNIVGLEIAITQLQGKAKLSQNKETRDRRGAVDALQARGSAGLAEAMRRA